ncbi:hypothetical protein MRX96_016596 [Rhipicephalus microplus]
MSRSSVCATPLYSTCTIKRHDAVSQGDRSDVTSRSLQSSSTPRRPAPRGNLPLGCQVGGPVRGRGAHATRFNRRRLLAEKRATPYACTTPHPQGGIRTRPASVVVTRVGWTHAVIVRPGAPQKKGRVRPVRAARAGTA